MRVQSAAEQISLSSGDLLVAGDNADVLGRLPAGSFDLIYMDPPFNTGRAQTRATLNVERTEVGDASAGTRSGFGGQRYRSTLLHRLSYTDEFDDYLGFLEPRLRAARELLAEHGTLYFHIDYREAHYCKLLLDEIFGRDAFLNELIWAYDYGGKPRRRWPAKHDTILVYVARPAAITLTPRPWTGSRTWLPAWYRLRRRRAASVRPTSGSTRSSPPTGARRPATRPRSPRGSCAGSSPRPRVGAAGAWIRSPAPEHSVRSAASWAVASS